MKLSRNHLSVVGAASKDSDGRPVLASIYAYQEDGKTVSVATDSYRLYEVRETTPEDDLSDHKLLVKATDAKFAQVMIKPHEYLSHVEVTDKAIKVNGTTQEIELREGQFPGYQSVMPSTKPVATVKINPNYLKEAMQFLKGSREITIEFHDNNKPVIIRAKDLGTDKLALIMPLRG